MEYLKPHLTLDQQLQLLAKRGLTINAWEQARTRLDGIGYYRLAAYLYPFRRLKPRDLKTTDWNFRFDEFEDESYFEDAVALYDFDSRLRRVLFEGLERLEISLRSQIANAAGEEDIYIHLRRELLDRRACNKRPKGSSQDAYRIWLSKYQKQIIRASGEDFIKHHKARYGDKLPVWVAMEVIDFGSVTHLFNFLPVSIKNRIARQYGVTQGTIFASWLGSFNYVRNLVAHHSRVWNKVLVRQPKIPGKQTVDTEIHHLSGVKSNKIYPVAALLAYSLRTFDPSDAWNLKVREVFESFLELRNITPQRAMGLPDDWHSLELWKQFAY